MTSDEDDRQKLQLAHLVRVRRVRESRVQLGQQLLAVNSLAVARLLIPGSPAISHKISIRDKGVGPRLMVTEMQPGTTTEVVGDGPICQCGKRSCSAHAGLGNSVYNVVRRCMY